MVQVQARGVFIHWEASFLALVLDKVREGEAAPIRERNSSAEHRLRNWIEIFSGPLFDNQEDPYVEHVAYVEIPWQYAVSDL